MISKKLKLSVSVAAACLIPALSAYAAEAKDYIAKVSFSAKNVSAKCPALKDFAYTGRRASQGMQMSFHGTSIYSSLTEVSRKQSPDGSKLNYVDQLVSQKLGVIILKGTYDYKTNVNEGTYSYGEGCTGIFTQKP